MFTTVVRNNTVLDGTLFLRYSACDLVRNGLVSRTWANYQREIPISVARRLFGSCLVSAEC